MISTVPDVMIPTALPDIRLRTALIPEAVPCFTCVEYCLTTRATLFDHRVKAAEKWHATLFAMASAAVPKLAMYRLSVNMSLTVATTDITGTKGQGMST